MLLRVLRCLLFYQNYTNEEMNAKYEIIDNYHNCSYTIWLTDVYQL